MGRSLRHQDLKIGIEAPIHLHYVSAGDPSHPIVLLLHGYPSSSHQFRNLMHTLAGEFYLLAPDLPGFGFTQCPADFVFNFDNLASVILSWLDLMGVESCHVYIFDYGAPVAFRIAMQRPLMFQSLISQNGNLFTEGISDWWAPLQKYWATTKDSQEYYDVREGIRMAALTRDAVKAQYTDGTPEHLLSRIDPSTYTLDYRLNVSQESERQDIQLDLFYDYRENVRRYSSWQKWLKISGINLLAIWGKNDIIFVEEGARAYQREMKYRDDANDSDHGDRVDLQLLDGGHFLLESHLEDVANSVRSFLRLQKP